VDTINYEQCECQKEVYKIIKEPEDLAKIVVPDDIVCKKHHKIVRKLILNLVFDRREE